MRKITMEVVGAFNRREARKIANTETDGTSLWLHGNCIARYRADGLVEIQHAGWPSNTTKERLNAVKDVSICQKKGQWYLNGFEWSGEWTCIAEWNESHHATK